MVPSTLFAFVAVMLVAVNGAILPRQGPLVSLTTQSNVSQSSGGSAPVVSSQPTGSAPAPASSAPAVSSQPTGSAPHSSAPASSAPAVSSQPTGSAPHSSAPASSAPAVSSQPSGSAAHSSAPASSATSTHLVTPSAPATSAVPKTTSASAAHTSSAPATTTSTPSGTANCNGVQQWQAAFAYTAGNKVIFNDQLFTANQWTYDNAPPSHTDQWMFDGKCSQPINNQANCGGVYAWQSTVAYTAGNKVTFDDHLWAAVQWTEANAPGDYSGTWQDMGMCA